jgi:uncharacterized surface anchored protein
MDHPHKIAVLSLGVVLLLAGKPCLAEPQGSDSSECSTTYENHNQIDYGPLKIHAIRGTNLIQVGSEKQPGAPGACFVLFTESDHKLVARVKAGPDGHFELKDVAPGRYRLIARLNGFCTANIPVEVAKSSRRKTEIVVHFRPRGIDTCSYGELAAPNRNRTTARATTSGRKG